MKRSWIGCALVALLLASCGGEPPPPVDAEISADGYFRNDSLGVTLALPASEGWSFQREPWIRGGSTVVAVHTGGTASLKLFVTPAAEVRSFENLLSRRRDQLASLFGIKDLDAVIEQVLKSDTREVDGFPVLQWQAVTEPVAVATGDPVKIMFLWTATLRSQYAYECVGLAQVPTPAGAEAQAASEALVGDLAFILQSMQVR